MRAIEQIILHCSATRADRRYTFQQCKLDHVNNRHWSNIGYHFYIEKDGSLHEGRPIPQVGAHCTGHNMHSIGICYEGGLDAEGNPCDTRTPQQKATLRNILRTLKILHPNVTIHGHNEFARKACPCFDAHGEYSDI